VTIEQARAKVEAWRSNLLENAAYEEREAGQRYEGEVARSIRQNARRMRHRAKQIDGILAILRKDIGVEKMTEELEARRKELLDQRDRLPPKRSFGIRRRQLDLAAQDCADAIHLLWQVQVDQRAADQQ
jgi:hypothetical protein